MSTAVAPPLSTEKAKAAPKLHDVDRIPLELVDVGDNVRTEVGDLADLTESIKAHGVLEPVGVRVAGSRYRLVFGQRRVLAARAAGLTHIPAIEASADPDGIAVVQLIENLQREDLNPLEEAKALRSILDRDRTLTQAVLARSLGRSEPWISNSLRLLELAKPVQELIAAGKLSGAHGKVLAGVDKAEQEAIAKDVAKANGSVRYLEDTINQRKRDRDWKADQQRAQKKQADAAVKALVDKKVNPATTQVVITGYETGGIAEAVKKAGYKVTTSGYYYGGTPPAKICDCAAVRLEVGYNGARILRHCVSEAHKKAAQKLTSAKDDRKREAAEANRQRVQAIVRSELEANPVSLQLGRLLAWKKRGNDWASDKDKKATWDAICALTVEQLNAELVDHIAGWNVPPIEVEPAAE